VNKQFPKRY